MLRSIVVIVIQVIIMAIRYILWSKQVAFDAEKTN